MKRVVMMLLVVGALGVAPLASALTVDGSLADWDVSTPTAVNGNNWAPALQGAAWTSEDWVGQNGYVGPAYGGQNSDIEAMYAYLSGNSLYIAIATGIDQTGYYDGNHYYKPGDVFLDFGKNGWDTAIGVGGAHTAGNVYTGTNNWWKDPSYNSSTPYAAWTDRSDRYHTQATLSGTSASVVYTNAHTGSEYSYGRNRDYSSDHNVVEICLGLDTTQLDAIYNNGVRIHWTLACGNDVIDLCYHPVRHDPPVPEPASLVLMGIGLAGFAVRRLRRRS